MEVITIEDIPYHTFVEYIAIHLDMRDFGALSMMSKFLRDTFMSNDVWKRLYVQTNRDKFKITDKSVHVGSGIAHHKSRTPAPETPLLHRDIWYAKWASPYPYYNSLHACGCVPRSAAAYIVHTTCHRIREKPDLTAYWLPTYDSVAMAPAAQEIFHSVIRGYNKDHQHQTHTHVCTNLDHYLLDTQDAPTSVRNFKNFRKQTLSKFLTQTKHDQSAKAAATRSNRKMKQLEKHRDYIRQLEREIDSDLAITRQNRKLSESLCVSLGK